MPRDPAPGLPLRTYPSPDISDQVLLEWVTSETVSAQALTPGTPHPNIREFPDFFLGKQEVSPRDDKFFVRYYVTAETNPDAWNYAIKFLAESNTHPIFIRAYRELKSDYVVRTKGTALQKVYKLTVTNAGTLYTPNTKIDLVFTGGAGSGAAGYAVVGPDGTVSEFVLTASGSGYTTAPTFTLATATSGTTATGSAAIQPTTAVLVSEEAQLFPAESEFYALYFNVIRVYQTLPGPLLEEQTYDETWDVVTPRTRQIVSAAAAAIGTNRVEVKAIDSVQSEEITVDPSTLIAAFSSYVLTFPGSTNVQLPDVLTSISAFIETQSGEGDDIDLAGTASIDDAGSWTISPRSSSQASVVAMPDVNPTIKPKWGANRKITHYIFLLPSPVTEAQVNAKLTFLINSSATATITIALPGVVTWNSHSLSNGDTVMFRTTGALPTGLSVDTLYYVVGSAANTFNVALTSGGTAINTSGTQSGTHTGYRGVTAWPNWNPQTETIFCVGGRASVQAKATATWHWGFNVCSDCGSSEESISSGSGESHEIGVTIKAVRIPATIHGAISISGTTSGGYIVDATADADAYVVSESRTATASINAYVTPTSLSATAGSTTIPSSGRWLLDIDAAPYKYGWIRYHCEVLNGTDL